MGLGIGDLEIGISVTGVYDYIKQINAIAITKGKDAVNNLDPVRQALQGGWQGAAEANFEKNMYAAAKVVCDTLDTLKKNLDSLFTDLVETMADQDNQLVPEVDDFTVM